MRLKFPISLMLAAYSCLKVNAQGEQQKQANKQGSKQETEKNSKKVSDQITTPPSNKQKIKQETGGNPQKVPDQTTTSSPYKPTKEPTEKPIKAPTNEPTKPTSKPTSSNTIPATVCAACEFTIGVVWAPDYKGVQWTFNAVMLWLSEQTYSDALNGPSVTVGGIECAMDVLFHSYNDNATLAVATVDELITQRNALAIIGLESSDVAIPIGQLANNSKVPVITTAALHPNVTFGRPYAFRMGFTNEKQAEVLASFAKFLNASRASIIFEENCVDCVDLANEFKNSWEYLGGSVLASVSSNDWGIAYADLSPLLAETDIFFFPVTPLVLAEVVSFTRGVGWEGPILGGDGWDDRNAINQCGDACDYTFYTSMLFSNISDPFFIRYNSTYGMMPNYMAALAYDSMNLIKETLIMQNKTVCYGNVESDRENFSDALKNTSGFIGTTGKIAFGVDNSPVNRCVALDIISNSTPIFYHGVC